MSDSKSATPSEGALPEAPACEVVTIGSELLLGQISDTNTLYLAEELARAGFSIRYRTTVGDRLEEIVGVLGVAVNRSDLVITTGGLGPTLDDLTREAVARSAGVELAFRPDLMEQIEELFRCAGYRMSENNRRQAFVPDGSLAIPNPVGTAPAFIREVGGRPVICLPGVPRELRYLMTKEIIPWLRKRFHLARNRISYRVLKAVGIGESKVDSLIGDLIRPGDNPEVGLLASVGEIRIRIAASAEDEEEADRLMHPVEAEIRARLGKIIFGKEEETLEGAIEDLLTDRGLTLTTFETFTAGIIAQRLNLVPSKRLLRSLIVQDNSQVASWAGCDRIVADEQSAYLLAEKIRASSDAEVGLAVLGFPGAKEGSALKAYAASSGRGVRKSFSWQMGGDLWTLRQRGAVIGLNTLRLSLLETD